MLETRALNAYYDESHVLRGVDLRVERGEVATLVGRNGSGKTTTLKSIMGMIRKHTGEIEFDGRSISRLTSDKIARCGIGFVPEDRGIYATLTVAENLTMPAIVGDSAWTLERIYALFPLLRERRKAMGTTLSGGEQQMLAMGRALMSHPRLLMLDEPSLGLSPILVETIFGVIREINQQGTTVLLIEQNARQALSIASRGYVLEVGRVVFEDTAANLMASEAVRAAYLGGAA